MSTVQYINTDVQTQQGWLIKNNAESWVVVDDEFKIKATNKID